MKKKPRPVLVVTLYIVIVLSIPVVVTIYNEIFNYPQQYPFFFEATSGKEVLKQIISLSNTNDTLKTYLIDRIEKLDPITDTLYNDTTIYQSENYKEFLEINNGNYFFKLNINNSYYNMELLDVKSDSVKKISEKTILTIHRITYKEDGKYISPNLSYNNVSVVAKINEFDRLVAKKIIGYNPKNIENLKDIN